MYTYAFFKMPAAAMPPLDGIAGSLRMVGNGTLCALVEDNLDLELIQQDDNQLVQAVLTHDRVICELFWQQTILPLRFGTLFVSEASLLHHLASHQDDYLAQLDHFEGKAEYRLKLTPLELEDATIEPQISGRSYFQAKKQRVQQQVDQRSLQHQELRQLLLAIASAYPNYILNEAQDGIEKLYLLVDRQTEGELYQNLQRWQDQCNHWELMLGEALPPYHFV
jgi:hypothetical protein